MFLCTANSARSQMAEGLLRHDAGDRFEVVSAGTRPTAVRPEAIAAMHEIGIDISAHRSKHLDDCRHQRFDYVITVCDDANDTCPVFPDAVRRLHWSFSDPAAVGGDIEQRLAAFRKVRDALRQTIRHFVNAGQTSSPDAVTIAVDEKSGSKPI